MESILDYVRRKLREAGPQQWETIARAAGCSLVSPRKIVYDRKNPGVNTIEPLYRYFQAIDLAAAKKATRKPATATAPDASATPAEHAKADERRHEQIPTARACLKRSTDRDGPTASRER
jgi:hypothetical protein